MPVIPQSAIIFTTLLVGLLTTGVLVLLPSTWRGDGRALRYWVIGNLLLSLDRTHTLGMALPGYSTLPTWFNHWAVTCVVSGPAMLVVAMRLLLQPERPLRSWRWPTAYGLVVAMICWLLDNPVTTFMMVLMATGLCMAMILRICWPQVRQLRGALVMAALMGFMLLMNIVGFVDLAALPLDRRTAERPEFPTSILVLDLVMCVVMSLAFLLILIELLHQRVERLSVTDPLTGVLNRRGFLQAANLQLLHVDRMRYPHRAASVLLLDLDHFKRINDSLGHAMGDAVLRGAAQRVVASLRQTDLLARWGGEEFVALLPGTRLPQAREVAERVRLALAQSPLADGAPIVTVSIGAAALEDALAVEELPALIAEADRRLYLAKRHRNCVIHQDEEHPQKAVAPIALETSPLTMREPAKAAMV